MRALTELAHTLTALWLRRHDMSMQEVFSEPLRACAEDARPLLKSPELASALQRVGTIAQIAVLQPCGRLARARPVTLINTHLFFHADAPHIRNLHVAAMVCGAYELAQSFQSGLRARPPLMLCGDLNSDVNNGVPGVLELLRVGRLPADFWDWKLGAGFAFDKDRAATRSAAVAAAAEPRPAEPPSISPRAGSSARTGVESFAGGLATAIAGGGVAVGGGATQHKPASPGALHSDAAPAGVDLHLPLAFQSSHQIDPVAVTNHVPGFSGCLDYIWTEVGAFRAQLQEPLPCAMGLAHLPNEADPSDHLPVVSDVEMLLDCNSDDVMGSAQLPLRPQRCGDDASVMQAAARLAAEGVIAVPTDTLYGLAAHANCAAAIARIYELKGRQDSVPLAICVGDVSDISTYGDVGGLPKGLLAALLPGPVTVVLRRLPAAPLAHDLNPGVETIAIRVLGHGFVRSVCRAVGSAIALTSANKSGHLSSTAVEDFQELWSELDAVFDGGPTSADRAGSTLVDLTCAPPRVIRAGAAHAATLASLQAFGLLSPDLRTPTKSGKAGE